MNIPPVTTPQCKALSSAGRRCEKADMHNTIETNPVHKAGAVTWNAPQGERLNVAEAIRKAMTDLGPLRPMASAERYFGYDGRGHRGGISGLFHTPVVATRKGDGWDVQPTASAEQQLAQWWRDKAEAEIDQTVAKAVEYGSTDLVDIGRSMARVAGRNDEIDDDEAAEWGIFFYLEGKLSRWRSALERGDRPSDDTLLDIGVYARMAQRIRSHGGWPGIEDEPELGSSGFPPFAASFGPRIPFGRKIDQVFWAGVDITPYLARNPDGSLNVSAEAIEEAVEKERANRNPDEPCTCIACSQERGEPRPTAKEQGCPVALDPNLPDTECNCKPKGEHK